jgi:hypothetical protein
MVRGAQQNERFPCPLRCGDAGGPWWGCQTQAVGFCSRQFIADAVLSENKHPSWFSFVAQVNSFTRPSVLCGTSSAFLLIL